MGPVFQPNGCATSSSGGAEEKGGHSHCNAGCGTSPASHCCCSKKGLCEGTSLWICFCMTHQNYCLQRCSLLIMYYSSGSGRACCFSFQDWRTSMSFWMILFSAPPIQILNVHMPSHEWFSPFFLCFIGLITYWTNFFLPDMHQNWKKFRDVHFRVQRSSDVISTIIHDFLNFISISFHFVILAW